MKNNSVDQQIKIVTLLGKRPIKSKEDLQKSGLSKIIMMLAKQSEGEALSLAKELI